MSLRIARPGDEGVLSDIARESFKEGFSEGDFKSTFNNPNMLTLVSENARGEIIAYCVASHAADEAELIQIAVKNKDRRSGVGRRMFTGLIDLLGGMGTKQLFLEVREGNASAISFYGSFGMTNEGRRPGFYMGPKEDALIFKLVI